MTHLRISHTSICVGDFCLVAPEFMPDSESEDGTPLVTPIHTSFGSVPDPTGISMEFERLTKVPHNVSDKCSLWESGYKCPMAPRVDNGSFDYNPARKHEPNSGLDTSLCSGTNNCRSDCSDGFNKALMGQYHLLGPEPSKHPRGQARRTGSILSYASSSTLEDQYRIRAVPCAPRPDTGSWLSISETVAPIINGVRFLSEKPTIHYSMLQDVAQSTPTKSISSKCLATSSKVDFIKSSIDGSPTRVVRWNLGLGLTLDDISEPDGCGTSIGEASVEFAEDSFFDLGIDSGFCSTTDTTLNTTTETIPDLVDPSPKNPVYEAVRIMGSELGITPQLGMLSIQGHHENVKRQRTQIVNMLRPGTRVAYTTQLLPDINAHSAERLDECGGSCDSSNGVPPTGSTLEFLAGEAQGIQHRIADTPIFTLLPPIEL
ncbi:unnamed protein product [Rhizoctonia solani]|uniref:Uncharacterized protein n=1 Tax=Rhizoctonia solani TaxID=456999 RepID=A0A8H2W942_9AGAM|nr:hypothetical protein RHS04_06819 [Rhizoctonia solani]CAE6339523.1 unnamed protein product [Rhizoctonia solani]